LTCNHEAAIGWNNRRSTKYGQFFIGIVDSYRGKQYAMKPWHQFPPPQFWSFATEMKSNEWSESERWLNFEMFWNRKDVPVALQDGVFVNSE